MLKSYRFFLMALIMLGMNFSSYAESIPGKELLSYFSSTCRSQGDWVRGALSQAESLIKSLDSVRSDPDCMTISGVMGQLNVLSARLVELQQLNQNVIIMEQYKAQEQELFLQIANTTDPITREMLEGSLRNLQFEMAGLSASNNANQAFNHTLVSPSLVQTVISTNILINQSLLNQTCLMKQPSLLTGISTLVGAVGSATALINPALSLGLATGTELLSQIIEGFKNGKISKAIGRVSQVTSGVAFQCVLESLSTQYCRAMDAVNFIESKSEYIQRSLTKEGDNPSSILFALRLYDREIPVFLSWLDKVRFGVTPQSEWDADRQNQAFSEQVTLMKLRRSGLGTIEQTRIKFSSAITRQEKWGVIRSLLNNLAPGYTGGGSPGGRDFSYSSTLGALFPSFFLPYYFIGVSESSLVPKNFGTEPMYFNDFDPMATPLTDGTILPLPSLDMIKQLFLDWIDKAETQVNANLNFVLQLDPLLVLTSAKDPTQKWRISPKNSIENLIKFLTEHVPHDVDNGSFKEIYQDTVKRLQSILQAIDIDYDFISDDMGEVKTADQRLAYIYKKNNLIYGNTFMQSRLEMMVRLSLFEAYRKLDNDKTKNIAAQYLASDHYVDVLSTLSGTSNFSQIKSDVEKSMPITLSTINNFVKVFEKNIEAVLTYYQSKENLAQEKFSNEEDEIMNKTHYRARAEMCFGLLAAETWPKHIPFKLCQNLKLDSVIPGGNSSAIIDEALITGSHEKRICQYRDYFRLQKIYQDLGIKEK